MIRMEISRIDWQIYLATSSSNNNNSLWDSQVETCSLCLVEGSTIIDRILVTTL